jgi:3-oxoadipate enol-lactonase
MPHLKTATASIHYRLDGPPNGPVVMLAHSLGIDLSMWDPQIPALTAAGYRALRYDHRGHGGSDTPAGPYTMAQLTEDAVDVMDRLELEKVHFCGLSMGGMVAQLLGARHAGRLHSLILCSTSSHMPPTETWDERIQTVREKGMAAVIDATLDRWITPAGQARLPGDVQKIRRKLSEASVEGFTACCAAIRDMDLREELPEITPPTLIMVGEHDPGTPVATARFIHERIAHSRLVVIADAAHLQNIEQSEHFTRTMLEFLGENSSSMNP